MDYDNDTHDTVPEYVKRIIEQRDAYKAERDTARAETERMLALADQAGHLIDRMVAAIERLTGKPYPGPRWAEISKGNRVPS